MRRPAKKVLTMVLAVLMIISMVPVAGAINVPELQEVELNKMVGVYATTLDPERSSAIFPEAQIADQTARYTLDASPGLVSLDFGVAANVRRVELISSSSGSKLQASDFDVYLGTETFGKNRIYEDHVESKAQTAKLSKQDYSIDITIRDGRDVVVFTFYRNAAAAIMVIRQKGAYSPATFVIDGIGRNIRAFGDYSVSGDVASGVSVQAAPLTADYIADDLYGDKAFSNLGDGAYAALDSKKGSSLILDMGEAYSVMGVTLRAYDESMPISRNDLELYYSLDGDSYFAADVFSVEQSVVSGRRVLTLVVNNDTTAPEKNLVARYIKLRYVGDDPAGAFSISNARQDISVCYDPFSMPGNTTERNIDLNANVSSAYADSRLLGEYGQGVLDKRNELSVEEFIVYYLDNVNSNFNYLYRWDNLGEAMYVDYPNISMALKAPSMVVADQIVVTGRDLTQNFRLTPSDWIISYSTDNRNFTVIPPDQISGYTKSIDGKTAYVLDFPAVEAATFIVYTIHTKNYAAPSAPQVHMIVLSSPASYKLYRKSPADEMFYMSPVKVSGISDDPNPFGLIRNGMFIDMGAEEDIKAIALNPLNIADPLPDVSELEVWYHNGLRFEKLEEWSLSRHSGKHVIVFESAAPLVSRYLMIRAVDSRSADYFTEKYGNDVSIHVSIDEEATLVNVPGRGSFIPGPAYLPPESSLVPAGITQAEVWQSIIAETSPVTMYQRAWAHGVSVGWAYRMSAAYGAFHLDSSTMRQSALLYSLGGAWVNRLVVTSGNVNDLRVTADDFRIAYAATFDRYDFTIFDESELNVTYRQLPGGQHEFTIDFPLSPVEDLMVYTTYSLDEPAPPVAGKNNFVLLPDAEGLKAYYVIGGDTWKAPASLKTISVSDDLLGAPLDPAELLEQQYSSEVFVDARYGSIGMEIKNAQPVTTIMLLSKGDAVISVNKDDYRIFVSDDNSQWRPVTDFLVSCESVAGKTRLRFDFETLSHRFYKVQYLGETRKAFLINDLLSDVKAFSITDEPEIDIAYRQNATIGFVSNDKAPATGSAGFGSTAPFAFDVGLNSIAADLGSVKEVNYIKLYDNDSESRIARQDLSIYVSDDNVTYTKIKDFTLRRDGNVYHLYNFSAAARYIKVNQAFFETNAAVAALAPLDYYASFKAENLQKMMNVYNMPLFDESLEPGVYPYGQGYWGYCKGVELSNRGETTLATNLIYLSYEYLELSALSSQGKLRNDYADVRFADAGGSMLPYYDDGSGFYVRLSDIPVGTTRIVMYYGNPEARSMSDGSSTLQVDFGTKKYNLANFGAGDSKALMLPDGRMMLANHGYRAGATGRAVQVCFSDNNGQTFGAYRRVTFNGNDIMGGLMLLPDGEVMLTYVWLDKNGGYGYYDDPEQTNVQVYAIFSSNNVTQWSEPVLISTGHAYNLSTSNALTAADGSIYVPVATALSGDGVFGICLMRSRDGGATWVNVTGMVEMETAGFEGGYSEPAVIELSDGVIRVFFRQGAGEEINKLGQITSYDNGQTWSRVEQSQFYSTCTQPALYKLESGRILLMWAGHNGTGSHTYQRMPLTVAYSDDGGETWEGYQELSGRTMFNNPFGHPQAMQPDFCMAPDGSLYVMMWMRGGIYSSGNSGAWFAFRIEDFDRWMEENTGAFDDFEQAGAVKGNYWYEMGPRVGVSEERSASGTKSLRISDNSSVDNAMAVRNFMGVKHGEVHFSFNYNNADSGLRFGLWECMPVFPDSAGRMFELDVSRTGLLSYVDSSGSIVSTGRTLDRDKWYKISMAFDVSAGTVTVKVDGVQVVQAQCAEKQSIIAYFAAYSTDIATSGTEFYLDDFMVIDASDLQLRIAGSDIFLTKVVPTAAVKVIPGNQNELTITITEHYSDGSTVVIRESIMIRNNAEGIYQVGTYRVFVNTKGNDQIRAIYIVE